MASPPRFWATTREVEIPELEVDEAPAVVEAAAIPTYDVAYVVETPTVTTSVAELVVPGVDLDAWEEEEVEADIETTPPVVAEVTLAEPVEAEFASATPGLYSPGAVVAVGTVAGLAAGVAKRQEPEVEAILTESEGELAVGAVAQAALLPDDLTKIKGIGRTYAVALQNAGIATYADLGASDAESLEAIIRAPAWRKVDYNDWIAQAQTLTSAAASASAGDDLTRLEGIGPAYASLLQAHGITTFAQLAASDETTLANVINAPAWRRVDYASWIAQAKLAAVGDVADLQELQDVLNRRESDNLSLIEGIGDKPPTRCKPLVSPASQPSPPPRPTNCRKSAMRPVCAPATTKAGLPKRSYERQANACLAANGSR